MEVTGTYKMGHILSDKCSDWPESFKPMFLIFKLNFNLLKIETSWKKNLSDPETLCLYCSIATVS